MNKTIMKMRFSASVAALLIAAVLTMPGAATAQSVDGIVAVVGDDVILASELAVAMQRTKAQLGSRADSIPVDTLKSNVLDQMILNRLQINRAKQLGLSVSKEDVARGVARLAQQNGLSMDDFVRALNMRGISLQALQQRVRENLLIGKVRKAEVMEDVVVTEQEVSRFLESRSLRDSTNREYQIRHIRLDVPADADGAAVKRIRTLAETLRDQAVSGAATFAALAKAQSDGDNAAGGGDMGWIANAFMPQVFTDIVPNLDIGEVSRVFRGDGAFHLVKLVDTRGSQNLAGGQQLLVDEIEVSHIVLQPNALRNSERTGELALGIRERLAAGARFADLARQYSDDKATASQGGSLGWIRPDQLGPREAVRVAQMQPGDVSPILETTNGYIIVKVTDRRQVDKTREAIRSRARQVIGRRKAEEKGQRWLRKLRAEAYVDIRLEGYQPSNS